MSTKSVMGTNGTGRRNRSWPEVPQGRRGLISGARYADALIASTYLAGTNTRRVRRALAALFGGAVGKDTVSRVWRKVKTDWEAWNARSLADEPIVRLILDGTVVRACSSTTRRLLSRCWSLFGVRRGRPEGIARDQEHGRRRTGRGRALSSTISSSAVCDGPSSSSSTARQGLKRQLGPSGTASVQRCTVHKHRNLLASAPERLHEEIGADYNDVIYAATPEEIEARRKAFIRKWRLKHRAVADSLEEAGDRLFTFTPSAAEPMAQRAHNKRHRAAARRVQAKDQNSNRAPVGRHCRHAVLGVARFRSDQHAKGRWLAHARCEPYRSAN